MSDRSPLRRVLFSRETLLGLLGVLVLMTACVLLGLWQFGRFEAKSERADVIAANYDAAPVPLAEVMPEPGAPLPPSTEWTPVTLTGSYCSQDDCVRYVRNRHLGTQVGFWQVVPFRTEAGPTVMVVRGWVPTAQTRSVPADPPPVPSGERTVTVRLRPAEVVLDREIPEGQAHSVHPRQLAGLMGLEDEELLARAFGELAAEDPPGERPAALPAPDSSLGPHLSYAVQWWIFALFFPGALIYYTRRRLQEAAEEQDSSPETAAGRTGTYPRPRRTARVRARGRDEEEEDALIDQRRP